MSNATAPNPMVSVPVEPTGPYRAEFGAIHHQADAGFLFSIHPESAAKEVARAMNHAFAVEAALSAPAALGALDLYDPKVQQGITWALGQVGAQLGAEDWAGGDGSESVEGDVGAEISNIMRAAGLVDADGEPLCRETYSAQPQAREDAEHWEQVAPAYRFGRTIRPDDVDYLKAGSLFRFYSSDPWFDDSGDMPRVGQIVRFTGNVERERFPALSPHLEVAALDGRVYPGLGWQCHLFQFVSEPDTHPAPAALQGAIEALQHYRCSCPDGACAMSDDDTDTPVDAQLCGRRAARALEAMGGGIA